MDSTESPGKQFYTSSSSIASPDVLNYNDEIPVYDGCDIPVNVAKDIDNLANILPAYISQDGEIPNGWCVLIAYTVSKFTARDKKESVGFNIKWVVVFPEPKDDD
ncbi:hypothetical protein FB451DRAFT_1195814 [Mycena latifolia]|nr:hypothetical protein FB451DRAFT_1195814 [Mycena latifolia]